MSGEAAWAQNVTRAGVTTALTEVDLALAARLSRQSLDASPGDPNLLRLLLRAQLALGDLDGARDTADALVQGPMTEDTLDALIAACLAQDQVARARDLVARAVAEETTATWAVEAARARIAIHQDDLSAARAILVRGIERSPEAQALRILMLEVLMADGDAAHAREVVMRLGQPATSPGPEAAQSAPNDAPDLPAGRSA